MSHPRKAFTLVELLVVIGIIALLISILLPSLARARQSALNVKCMAMMQQMGVSWSMYFNENRGKFLGWNNWPYTIVPYLGFSGRMPNDSTPNDPTRSLPEMFASTDYQLWSERTRAMGCAQAVANMGGDNGTRRDYRTIAQNRYLPDSNQRDPQAGTAPKRPGMLSRIKTPSETLHQICTGAWNPGGTGNVGNQYSTHSDPMTWYPSRFAHFGTTIVTPTLSGSPLAYNYYSDGKSNVLFFDGHVESLTAAELFVRSDGTGNPGSSAASPQARKLWLGY